MSGFEAVGLTIGIIPLLVSVAENYEVTFRPFITYCRYCEELRDFRTTFATQKHLFESHCLTLLARVGAESVWEERSSNLEAGILTDEQATLEANIVNYLGKNEEVCRRHIQLIRKTVLSIQKETSCLAEVASKNLPLGSKLWCRAVRQQVKFSVSLPRLKGKISDLRELNGDFLALIQSTKILENAKQNNPTCSEPDPRHSVESFVYVQTASQRLHEALSDIWKCKCSAHSIHSAGISVDRKLCGRNSNSRRGKQRIHFDMTFDFLPRFPGNKLSPIWLGIETSSELGQEREQDRESLSSPVYELNHECNSLKRSLDDSGLDLARPNSFKATKFKKDRHVSSILPFRETRNETGTWDTSNALSHPEKDVIPDLCSKKDLCLFLEELCQSDKSSKDTSCVGVLTKPGTFKHLVYQRPHISAVSSVSLHSILSNSPDAKLVHGLSSLQKVQLAQSLSMVPLYFNDSPWLPETWRSSNVHFYGLDQDGQENQDMLRTPFLSIQSPHDQLQNSSEGTFVSQMPSQDPLSPIRNNVLFGLGVIFLELGFESPINVLQRPDELKEGQRHQYSDFLTANRLKGSAGKPLGGRFGRVARKCLDCDFATGDTDLQSLALQTAFYKDVVLELDALEKLLQKLEI